MAEERGEEELLVAIAKTIAEATIPEATIPEAPASASVRCQIEGFEWLITVRGFETDGTAGRKLIEKIKPINEAIVKMGGGPIFGRGNGGKAAVPVDTDHPAQKECPVHAGAMMDRKEKDGQIWYSHVIGKDASGKSLYCNGKEK